MKAFTAGILLFALPLSSIVEAQWAVPGDYPTIQAAIDSPAVLPGAVILVGPGEFDGAVVNKKVVIVGVGRTVIKGGPKHPSGLNQGFRLLAGSDGSAFGLLHFASTADLSIMSGAAVDGVHVLHCTFENVIQAVSNWGGSGWEISQNVFVDLRTRCGGGIAILIGDYAQHDVRNNTVSHNTISGRLHVHPNDCGGYNGTGIVLYSDNRFGRIGAKAITANGVYLNRIQMTLDDPRTVGNPVDIVAFELTDTSLKDTVITGNVVAFNDWRSMENQIALTPVSLDSKNVITRNLGNNRGGGVSPSTFMPK